MNFYKELCTYIESENANLSTLVTGFLPASPDNCIAMIGNASQTIGDQRDVPGLMFPRFQLIIRNTDFDLAEQEMYALRDILHGIINLALPVVTPEIRILRIHADQEGAPIGQDAQGRFEFSINFSCEINAIG